MVLPAPDGMEINQKCAHLDVSHILVNAAYFQESALRAVGQWSHLCRQCIAIISNEPTFLVSIL